MAGMCTFVGGSHRYGAWNAMESLYEVQKRGAGEILLTSMDADGSMQGFDLPVLEQASKICKVPLIASGGAGTMEHFAQAARAGADAMLAASLFHFGHLQIGTLKKYLDQQGIPMRLDGIQA